MARNILLLTLKCAKLLQNASLNYRLCELKPKYVPALANSFTIQRNYGTKVPKKEKDRKKKPKVLMSEEELEQVIDVKVLNDCLGRAIEGLKTDYIKHLAIRGSPGTLENLPVKFENNEFPLNQIAQLSKKNPQLFIINAAATPQAVKGIVEAIQQSGMNLNTQLDGTTIFVTIPKVTKEHRENLAKNAKTMFTNTKTAIQEIQKRFIKDAKSQKSELSEDLIFYAAQNITAIANDYITQAEKLMQQKQIELLGTN